jgi:hypothetical protein
MSTKAFVGPQLSFTIYGVAGPTLMADPFLRLDGNINLEEWYLGLSRGIEGYLGFQVRILSWLLVSYYTPLFAEESVLWDTSGQIQQNHPPDPPLNPSPANGNDDVPVTILLEWDCSDPDGDPLLYDVYFGTDPTPDEGELVSENQSQEYYNPPGNLDYGTTYYWQIMAEDDEFETEGPIWNFTTTGQGNQPPNPPSNPNPPNNSTGQPININVSWTCTDPDGDPLNFDVYFGTMSPPPLVSLNQSQTTYDPGQLENSTIYYWRIVAIDNQQDSTGSPQWNFTTTDDTSLFSSPIGYATGTSPNGISSADFDGDGDNDIAVACYSSDAVSILLNNSDGTFQPSVNYAAGDSPYSVFAADFDGDGDNDLVVPNLWSDDIYIFLNAGNGTFQMTNNYWAGDGPLSAFAADLDGDNDNDLAITENNSHVSIFINNGSGIFAGPTFYLSGDSPRSVFIADLDNDGDNDLAVANLWSHNVSILMNNGNATFQSAVGYGTDESPVSVYADDLDGDGDYDLVTANCGADNFSVLFNNGNGTFQSNINYGVGDCPHSVSAADLDEDGDSDLAIVYDYIYAGVSIFFNNGTGMFQLEGNYNAGSEPNKGFLTDVDGDGDNDLIVSDAYFGGALIFENQTR